MGFEHAFLNQMPWYHKLWFIPGIFIGFIMIGLWRCAKTIFSHQ